MNADNKVINDFGEEWDRFSYLSDKEMLSIKNQFLRYIQPLPEDLLNRGEIVAADFGAGTGRWSYFLKDYCRRIYVLEPSKKAFEVCRQRFLLDAKVTLLNQSVEENSIERDTLDLAVSLGVLHHIPDTQLAINSIHDKIKPGGYFLGYLYYALENKPLYYKCIWRVSELLRKHISRAPKTFKFFLADILAVTLYFPLARFSKLLSKFGIATEGIPLHHYSTLTYKVMRNDALDRFGTSLEKRFTKIEIQNMLESAGFEGSTLMFSALEPFWTFSIRKKRIE